MSCRIAILGAGISGLATAWFLKQSLKNQVQLTILDKKSKAGGWIETCNKEGYIFEQGPHSCRSKGNGKETLALIEALGLQNEILTPHRDSNKRYVYGSKGLQKMPQHLWEIPFNPLTKGWPKALWRDWCMPKRIKEDESIEEFFSRRLGKSWVQNLIDPFVSGIYAGDCNRLSLKSCFPLFDNWEQKRGSLLLGAWHDSSRETSQSPFVEAMRRFPIFSFKEGIEAFPRALAGHLKDCLQLGQAVKKLTFHSLEGRIELENGAQIKSDYIISTLPTHDLAPLLSDYPSNQKKLEMLNYATVLVVNLGFDSPVLKQKGFGYLIPSYVGSIILGCIWDSSVFPQQNSNPNQTRLTFLMGGSRHPSIEEISEHDGINHSLRALYDHMGIKANPQVIQVKKIQHAIPQYEIGYSQWKNECLQSAHLDFPRLILSGTAWNGVSINDGIAHARQLALQLASQIEKG